MRNIEIKARLRDVDAAHRALAQYGAARAETLHQRDVYFYARRGRLKLRIITHATATTPGAELIAYERADAARPRASTYERIPVPHADALLRGLDATLGRRGEVRKTRDVFLHTNVRIHLDDVVGLGNFVEIEAVVDATHAEPACHAQAATWMQRLGIRPDDIEPRAYIDLLLGAANAGG